MRESIGGSKPSSDKKNNLSMSIDFGGTKTARAKGSEDSEDMRQVISILNDQILQKSKEVQEIKDQYNKQID